MRTYGILRRDGWRSTSELEAAVLRSSAEGERMADEVAWTELRARRAYG